MRVANKRFMVKSVPEDEFEVLRSILYGDSSNTHPTSTSNELNLV